MTGKGSPGLRGKQRNGWAFGALATALLLSAVTVRASSDPFLYRLVDIGSLGGATSRASALNERGDAVGEAETADGELRAFLWSASGGMRDLGTLGGIGSRAFDVNDALQVVGESTDAEGNVRAFCWTPDGGMTALPGTETTRFSSALAINAAGQIVGVLEDAEGTHAVLWTNGGFSLIPRLPGPGFMQPLDINDSGDVVGQIQTGLADAFASHAFYFRRAAEARHLGTFRLVSDRPGGAITAVNNRGLSVGCSMLDDGTVRPIRCDSEHAPERLPDHDALYGNASDINDRGAVVGSVIPSYASDETASLWLDGRWFDLNEVTDAGGTWWLIQAASINNRGMIAGYGVQDDRQRGWVLMPVEHTHPAAWPEAELTLRDLSEHPERERLLILTASWRGAESVRRVSFYDGDTLLGSVEEPPYEWGWQGEPDSAHEFRVDVRENQGRLFRSPRVMVPARVTSVAAP